VSMYYILLISFGAADHVSHSPIKFSFIYNIIALFKNLFSILLLCQCITFS